MNKKLVYGLKKIYLNKNSLEQKNCPQDKGKAGLRAIFMRETPNKQKF